MRSLALLMISALLAPSKPALADDEGSTIRVIRREAPRDDPERDRAGARASGGTSSEASPSEAAAEGSAPDPETREAPGVSVAPEGAALPMPRARPGPLVSKSPPPRRDPALAWITLGASAALGVVGAVFAAEAGSAFANDDLELVIEGDRARVTDAFRDAQTRAIDNTIFATAFLSAASAGTVVGLVLLFDG